ncbi:hypothetical protein [Amaricoccus macauensis]|uniref:hypothetical protein n=1 Tax=Amaricoccus macauensis TaxID=57001 RepID=UPI003C7977E4
MLLHVAQSNLAKFDCVKVRPILDKRAGSEIQKDRCRVSRVRVYRVMQRGATVRVSVIQASSESICEGYGIRVLAVSNRSMNRVELSPILVAL